MTRIGKRLATLAAVGATTVLMGAAPALAYSDGAQMMEQPEDYSGSLCTWASQTYSPGARIASQGGVFECQSNGNWTQIR